jgi:Xaa-Pro aminopeptidase
MKSENLLMVADSERDADMLYAVGLLVPDPLIYLRLNGQPHLFTSDLETDRVRKRAGHCRVRSWSRYVHKLHRAGIQSPGLARLTAEVLREKRFKRLVVPSSFPLGLARELRRFNIKVKPRKGSFFPERQFKTADEVKKISAALIMAEVGLAEALQVLKNAKVAKDRRLFHHHIPLTAEKLRAVIDTAILQAGGVAAHTIVACGRQACDPHEEGHGVLRAHQPIVLDVFPRSQRTGYYGDITRTVVKGRASEAVRRLYATVARAQELAMGTIEGGVPGAVVHQAVEAFFSREGYRTGRTNGCLRGFFHGTGHGLGLELHEPPRLAPSSPDLLSPGHVVTVEPGLYYPGLGGVRLEDVVLVTPDRPRNLTKFEKVLEV